MNLKTSGSMHFHGADGIHIGLNKENAKLILYYSEVKVYKDVNTAIKNCIDSITPLLRREEKETMELDLLSSHIDLGNNDLEKALKNYFNPNRVENRENTEVRGLCLIAFNESKYSGLDYTINANNILPEVSKWVKKLESEKIKHGIKDIVINVFFIPMTCVDTFRNSFKNKLGVFNE